MVRSGYTERELYSSRISDKWMRQEGIPIYKGDYDVEDITELPRRPWARLRGYGTFIELEPTWQAGKMLYVAEIPGAGALEPEKHLYNETIYILRGRGLSEVWYEGEGKHSFEWGERSLFNMPPNAWHRLVNGGREPVLFFAQTNAPVLMEAFQETEFIFNCDYKFTSRYSGETDYFAATEKRRNDWGGTAWETNFVPDVLAAHLEAREGGDPKVSGGRAISFRMAGGPAGNTDEWPVGRYHKAHFHGPGAVLLCLQSEGYTLLWNARQYGIHPYTDGYGDKVLKAPWKVNSIFSPGRELFHQHFNTGPVPARLYRHTHSGSRFVWVWTRAQERARAALPSSQTSLRQEGGHVLDYDDEDPEIRRMFEEELREKGIKCTMPPVVYRTDRFTPFMFSPQ